MAIISLMFSPGINGGECKSVRSVGGASADPTHSGWPRSTSRWERCVWALPLAEAWEEEPASVGATESEVPSLSGLILLLLQPLLRHCYAIRWVSVVEKRAMQFYLFVATGYPTPSIFSPAPVQACCSLSVVAPSGTLKWQILPYAMELVHDSRTAR